jgi:hypothetical protein
MAGSRLPSGTVTFLFTDIEGSTRLLHELGQERYAEALELHRHVVRASCTRHGGVEVDTQGMRSSWPSRLHRARLFGERGAARERRPSGSRRAPAQGSLRTRAHLPARRRRVPAVADALPHEPADPRGAVSTRASCATRTSASGCWRRSAPSLESALPRPARSRSCAGVMRCRPSSSRSRPCERWKRAETR